MAHACPLALHAVSTSALHSLCGLCGARTCEANSPGSLPEGPYWQSNLSQLAAQPMLVVLAQTTCAYLAQLSSWWSTKPPLVWRISSYQICTAPAKLRDPPGSVTKGWTLSPSKSKPAACCNKWIGDGWPPPSISHRFACASMAELQVIGGTPCIQRYSLCFSKTDTNNAGGDCDLLQASPAAMSHCCSPPLPPYRGCGGSGCRGAATTTAAAGALRLSRAADRNRPR
mmetsp:Transcript_74/g.271  ORF Transcript_74/g.271 Transcript_74/m.271 type:complete len:228 (-) Transcript_74:131-814(-)